MVVLGTVNTKIIIVNTIKFARSIYVMPAEQSWSLTDLKQH